MKTQKEAERAEQQRIKNLVLNYDLQDSGADPDGTDNAILFPLTPNPNLRSATQSRTFAHEITHEGLGGEKNVSSHHQHNVSLHQSSSSNANARSSDKSGTNRSGQRSRKLQLNELDWYEQKPGSSHRSSSQRDPSHRGRGRAGPRGQAG